MTITDLVLNIPVEYRICDNTKLIVRAGRKTGNSDSDINGEPVIHVGQDKLFPKGNCHKHGCTVCTPYDQCIKNDEDRVLSKKQKSKDNNPIISEEERALLQQLKRHQKWQSHLDVGPIDGEMN